MDIGYSTAELATAVVLMTAYQDLPTVATAMREGAVDFLVKLLAPPSIWSAPSLNRTVAASGGMFFRLW